MAVGNPGLTTVILDMVLSIPHLILAANEAGFILTDQLLQVPVLTHFIILSLIIEKNFKLVNEFP